MRNRFLAVAGLGAVTTLSACTSPKGADGNPLVTSNNNAIGNNGEMVISTIDQDRRVLTQMSEFDADGNIVDTDFMLDFPSQVPEHYKRALESFLKSLEDAEILRDQNGQTLEVIDRDMLEASLIRAMHVHSHSVQMLRDALQAIIMMSINDDLSEEAKVAMFEAAMEAARDVAIAELGGRYHGEHNQDGTTLNPAPVEP